MNHNLPKTYRKQIIEGVSIPGLIRNGNHYFTDLEIYEDGRVECWNFQDFAHFKKDVHRGWVAVNIPDGERISIHSLGEWTINKGAWATQRSILHRLRLVNRPAPKPQARQPLRIPRKKSKWYHGWGKWKRIHLQST